MRIDGSAIAQDWRSISQLSVTQQDDSPNVQASIKSEDMQEPVQVISQLKQEDINDQDLRVILQDGKMKKELDKMLQAANEIIFGTNSHFQFKIHEKTGTTMVKLIDNNTDKVIKEFPPEKILNVVAGIWELAGILVDHKA